MFNALTRRKCLSSLQFQCKKVLVYLIIFTQIYSPAAYGGKLYFEIDEVKTNPSNKKVINLKIWEEDSLRLMHRSDPLNQLREKEVGVFCKGDQLFCKAYGKDPILVDKAAIPEIHSESFDKIRKTIQKGEQQPHSPFDALAEKDEAAFLQFTNLCGYTQKESSIYENIIEYTIGNNKCIDCKLPDLKPKIPFHTPVELKKCFDPLNPTQNSLLTLLRISHHENTHKEELDFTVDHWGNIEFHALKSPRRCIFVKIFGDILVKPISDYKVRVLPTNPQPVVPKTPYPGMALTSSFGIKLRSLPLSSSLDVKELGLYLKGEALYCKIKDREEIELINEEKRVNQATACLSLESKLFTKLKKAMKAKIDPKAKYKKALLELAELSAYIPTALSTKSLHLTGKNIFCDASIMADDTLNITATQKLNNKSWLFGDSIHLAADTLKNKDKIISSNALVVDVKTLFKNLENAHASATNTCILQGTGRLQNLKEGEIKSSGTLVSCLPEVDNDGFIIADLSISFESPLNNLRNSWTILSHGTLGIHALQAVTNNGFLEGRYGKTAITAQELLNGGSIASLNGPLFLRVRKGENHNSILSQNAGGVHLTIGELFENFNEIKSDDFIVINGVGHLHNTETGTIKTPEKLQITDVSVTNEGLMEACKKLSAAIPLLVQRGLMKASEAFLDIKDLQNFSKILIEEFLKLIVGKGRNYGHIQGKTFAFTVLDKFTNKSAVHENKPTLHGGKLFALDGSGRFTNQHIVRAEDFLTLQNKRFLNEGQIEAGGKLNIGNGITLTNAQGAKLLSKGSFKTASTASLTNHRDGLFSSQGNMVLAHLLSFSNEGTFYSKAILSLISSSDLDNQHNLLGDLRMYLEAAGLISNRGVVETPENITMQAAQILNHKKIQGTKDVTLKSSHNFENKGGAEVNSSKGKVTLVSPQLTIQGPVKGQTVDVEYQGTTPFQGNVAAIDTLTLHVPYGWSLENKAQAFGHSIVLHGPIRHPGNVNIKGDFTWNNSEALSNDFDIIVGGKLNFNIPGSWCNPKLVEAQKGSTVTTPHFSNRGVFNSCEITNFTCAGGFENYDFFRMQGGGAIHTSAGSILNHPEADFYQSGYDKVLIFNASQKVRNRGGRVHIEGTLNATSTIFANEITEGTTVSKTKPFRQYNRKTRTVEIVTRPIPGATLDTPGKPASFHAGRALVTAHTLLNRGSALSTRELLHFNGTKLDNLTQDYFGRGTKVEEHKKSHRKWYGKKKTKRTYETVPYATLVGSSPAKLKSQGDMNLTVGGRVYDRNNVAALNGNNLKNTKIKRVNRKKNQVTTDTSISCITNTGHIYADAAYFDLDVTSSTCINFSEVNNHRTTIPSSVSLLPYYEEMLNGPRFWTLDDERNTPYKIISRLYTPLPSAEETAAQRLAANEARKAHDADLPAFREWMRQQLTEQFNKDWDAKNQKQKRGLKSPQTREAALAQYLEEYSDLCVNWEPNTDELAPTSPESLPHPAPRIAVVANSNYIGGERLLSDLTLLANQVIKVTMNHFGVPTLSRNIFNPLLYTRLLEDEGYINARRVRGLPPLPTPENWLNLSPKEQLRSQLREIITLPEAEHFKDPAIIYELVNFHGENVLSAVMTFPKAIRKAFEFLMGRKMYANYFGMKTKGDVAIRHLDPRGGARIESTEGSIAAANVLSQGDLDFKAALDLDLSERIEGDSIHGKGGRSVKVIGADLTAKTDIILESDDILDIIAMEIRSLTKSGGKKNRPETLTVRNKKTTLVAGRDILGHAKGKLTCKGGDGTAGRKIHLKSDTAVDLQNVHDLIQENHTRAKKKWLGMGHTKGQQNTYSTMIRNRFNAPKVGIEGEDDLNIDPTDFNSPEGTILTSHTGVVKMNIAKSLRTSAVQKQRHYGVWQKQQSEAHLDEKIETTSIVGPSTFQANNVVIEKPKDVPLSTLTKAPSKAWMGTSNATLVPIEETHEQSKKKTQGLTPAGAALLGLGVTILTAGAGVAALGPAVSQVAAPLLGSTVAGDILGTMAIAGANTFAVQTSIAVVDNRGNVGKASKKLVSKQNLKALGVSVATAGLTEGVLGGLDALQAGPAALTTGATVSQTGAVASQATTVSQAVALPEIASLMDSIESIAAQAFSLPNVSETIRKTAVQASVSAGIAVASGEKNVLEQGLRTVAATVGQTVAARAIGDAYDTGTLGFVEHKLSHGIAGAFSGALFSEDPASGAISGAIGASVAELVVDFLPTTLDVRDRADLGRVTAGLTALAANQNVNTAILTGTTAVTENTERHAHPDEHTTDASSAPENKGGEEGVHKQNNALESLIEGVKNLGEQVVEFFKRPPSPRLKEAYIEQGIQFGKANVLDPLNQTQAGQAIHAFNKSVNEDIDVFYQNEEAKAKSGHKVTIPDIRGAFAPEAVVVKNGLEQIPAVVRRGCRFVGISPELSQDAGDGVKAAIDLFGPGKSFTALKVGGGAVKVTARNGITNAEVFTAKFEANAEKLLKKEQQVIKPATKSIPRPSVDPSPLKKAPSKPLEIELHRTPETDALFRQTRAFEKAQALENKQRAAAQAVGNTPPAFKNLTPPRPANTITAPQTRAPSVSVGSEPTGLQRQIPPPTFPKLAKEYIRDMEIRSDIKIPATQRLILKNELKNKNFEKLPKEQYKEHQKIYDNPKVKEQLRQDWEKNTGQKWPTYTENAYNKNGGILYEAGDPYQIHHVIHQNHGGPHEWWNAHPVPLSGHQGGVHGSGAPGQILHGK